VATVHDLERTTPTARAAAKHEEKWLADVFARAFWNDPIFGWLHPNTRTRYAAMRRFFLVEIRVNRKTGRTVTTTDLAAVAAWSSPGHWKAGPIETIRMAPAGLLLASDPKAAMAMFAKMEKAHPTEPHWYLATVGSDPNRRGTGAGAVVINAVLDDCDRDGLAAYLESSKPENVPYYERFGFVARAAISAGGSPPLVPMWRDPR